MDIRPTSARKKGFSVSDGGRSARPGLLVVGVDDVPWLSIDGGAPASAASLSQDEASALGSVAREVPVALMGVDAAALAALAARVEGALVVAPQGDAVSLMGEAGALADALAGLCASRGLDMRDVAVIAVHGHDAEAMLAARWALALRDAGDLACRGADAVFGPRAEGGLVGAIDAAAALLRR